MTDWTEVAPVDEFPPGSRRVVDVDDVQVLVFNIGGEYLAIEDVCTHDYSSFDDGELDGEEIICPRHGARFSVRSGEALCAPAYEPVATFPTMMKDDMVWVRDDRWD